MVVACGQEANLEGAEEDHLVTPHITVDVWMTVVIIQKCIKETIFIWTSHFIDNSNNSSVVAALLTLLT